MGQQAGPADQQAGWLRSQNLMRQDPVWLWHRAPSRPIIAVGVPRPPRQLLILAGSVAGNGSALATTGGLVEGIIFPQKKASQQQGS
jgi:hypothetical protein